MLVRARRVVSAQKKKEKKNRATKLDSVTVTHICLTVRGSHNCQSHQFKFRVGGWGGGYNIMEAFLSCYISQGSLGRPDH